MCGLAGFFRPGGLVPQARDHALSMADQIVSRGPDDAGVWTDEGGGIALAHRRLSVLDLTQAGHQPMVSSSGRYVIAFNGEIYNHLALRDELAAAGRASAWRGHSDTETLLAGFDVWGIDATVRRVVGMFAFAIWDRQARTLTLGRDRLGEKPLYYGWQKGTLLFGSELKALRSHPDFLAAIDRDALALMMRYNAIPAPYSIYQAIRKLPPGTTLALSAEKQEAEPRAYWDACHAVAHGLAHPFTGTPSEAVDRLDVLLQDAVGRQMVADVPLGAFLSGGVDSSVVVALMQAQSSRPVHTFTIGFHEAGYDEAGHAKAVARHLGTNHTELYVTARQAMDVIPRLPSLYCEPFADASQIPTFLVSQLARRHVTVALSGDGGDELFGGYSRYLQGQRLWGRVSRWPLGLRRPLAMAIRALPPRAWDHLFPTWRLGDKLHKGAALLAARTSAGFYRDLVSHWPDPSDLVLSSREPPTALTDPARQPLTDEFVHQMMALDLVSYLPDDILVKVDRAAMGASLETRVPLLDHRLVEYAWTLPQAYKLRDGEGKWPLRQLLYRYVPRELIDRPKMGFGVPLDSWLRGPLRDWAEGLLDEARLRQEGYLNATRVRATWREHLAGQRDWQYRLWGVLMFQAWLAER